MSQQYRFLRYFMLSALFAGTVFVMPQRADAACAAARCEAGDEVAIISWPTGACLSQGTAVKVGNTCHATCNLCAPDYDLEQTQVGSGTCKININTCVANSGNTGFDPICAEETYSSLTCGTALNATIDYCEAYGTDKCFGGRRVRTCNTCTNGYVKESGSLTVVGCSNQYTYYKCVAQHGEPIVNECDTVDDCRRGVWSRIPDEYGNIQRTTATDCLFHSCVTSTQYACGVGWYSTDGSETSTSPMDCTQCPQPSFPETTNQNVTVTTGSGPATSINDCYVFKGTFSDDSGTWSYSSLCYYQD